MNALISWLVTRFSARAPAGEETLRELVHEFKTKGPVYRPVRGVVAAELQHLQQRDQAVEVMPGVGGAQRGLHGAPVIDALALIRRYAAARI